MENIQLSKQQRDEQKAKDRMVKRMVFWSVALVVIVGGIFGIIKLASINKDSLLSSGAGSVATVKADDHTFGNPQAKVVLIEYADFQCPACRAYYPVVKQINDIYKDKVLFVYRHFPLPQHGNAKIAAQASEAASNQGKFWEMHDALFDDQDRWTTENASRVEETLAEYATKLGLNVDKFKTDLNTNATKDRVLEDSLGGQEAGVNGTPTFFLNGKVLDYASINTIDKFRSVIDVALSESANSTTTTSVK